jgi:hypothetical protein
MGSALHRIQILLIGVILVGAGLAAAVIAFVAPPTHTRYAPVAPQPVVVHAPMSDAQDVTDALTIATAAAVDDAAAALSSSVDRAPIPTVQPRSEPAAVPSQVSASVSPPAPTTIDLLTSPAGVQGEDASDGTMRRSLWLLACIVAVGIIGVAVVLPRRCTSRFTLRPLPKARWSTSTFGLPLLRWPRLPRLPNLLARRSARRQRTSSLELSTVSASHLVALEGHEQCLQPVSHPEAALVQGSEAEQEEAGGAQSLDCLEIRSAPVTLRPHEALDPLRAATDTTLPSVPISQSAAEVWTAEDRVLAVAQALSDAWAELKLDGAVLALDTAQVSGGAEVVVTVDAAVSDEQALPLLPQHLEQQHSGWQAHWRDTGLAITVLAQGAVPSSGPLLAPVLDHGRRQAITRFYPLSTWRHLAIYGQDAFAALHTMLHSVLWSQSPRDLALSILDRGEISRLYRDVPHRVASSGDALATIAAIGRAVRTGSLQTGMRPVLVVVVEPDAALLGALTALVRRLRKDPTLPLHLLLVQTRLHSEGRELYAVLPALVTAGGVDDARWLPGGGGWPKKDHVRLVGRGSRVEGRLRRMDEAEIVSLMRSLPQSMTMLPPVLWDPLMPVEEAVASSAVTTDGLIAASKTVAETAEEMATTLDGIGGEGAAEVPCATATEQGGEMEADAWRTDTQEERQAVGQQAHVHAGGAIASKDTPSPVNNQSTWLIQSTHDEDIDVPDQQAATRLDPSVMSAPLTAYRGEDTPTSSAAQRLLDLMTSKRSDATVVADGSAVECVSTASVSASMSPSSVSPMPPEQDDPVWPGVAGHLRGSEVRALFERMGTDEAFKRGFEGVSFNRLREVLPPPQRTIARRLLVWFDQAGILHDPPSDKARYQSVRPLRSNDAAWLAAQLRAYAFPSQTVADAVVATTQHEEVR